MRVQFSLGKKMQKGMLLLLLALIAITVIIMIGPQNRLLGKEKTNHIKKASIPLLYCYEINNDATFIQEIIPQYDYIKRIGFMMLETGEENSGELEITLSKENGDILTTVITPISEITPGQWRMFDLNTYVKEGKTYQIGITVRGAKAPIKLQLANPSLTGSDNGKTIYQGENLTNALYLDVRYSRTNSLLYKLLWCGFTIIVWIILSGYVIDKDFGKKMKAFCIEENDLKRNVYLFGMIMLGIAIAFLHIYKITEIPFGYNVDELGSAYDAYCLANWGVDRFRISYPVYFINVGDGQNALYAYMILILIKIFGYSKLMIRIPAIINAFMTVYFGAGLIRRKWNKNYAVLTFTSVYAILPIFIQTTRHGLESYLMTGFVTMFIYVLVKAIEDAKKRDWFLAGICGGLVLYTYAISYLVMIAFVLVMLVYVIWIKKIDIRQFLLFALSLGILAMPLVLCQIINMFDLPQFQIGPMTITKFESYRGSELGITGFFTNFKATLNAMFDNDERHFNAFPEHTTMYWPSIFLFLLGLVHALPDAVKAIKRKEMDISAVMLAWFILMFIMCCFFGKSTPNCNRINGIYIACLYFIIEGLIVFIQLARENSWSCVLLVSVAICYFVCFCNYAEFYFHQYVKDFHPDVLFEDTYTEALDLLNTTGEEIASRKTYIGGDHEDKSIIFYCGSTLISPYEIDYRTCYQDDVHQYKNYVFKYDGETEADANYILAESKRENAVELESLGFIVQKVNGWFVCYNPLQ